MTDKEAVFAALDAGLAFLSATQIAGLKLMLYTSVITLLYTVVTSITALVSGMTFILYPPFRHWCLRLMTRIVERLNYGDDLYISVSLRHIPKKEDVSVKRTMIKS